MARYVRLFGLASIVIVDDDKEIDDLIDHPALVRDFEVKGPIVNRRLVRRLNREFQVDGRTLLAMRDRQDGDRQENQIQLMEKLDQLATAKSWSSEATETLANYVATGNDLDGAKAALAYVTAYPFLTEDEANTGSHFDRVQFARLFALYERLSRVRRPISVRGILARLTRSDNRARRALLKAMNGNENGLHAVAVTLDNSLLILESMRSLTLRVADSRRRQIPFRWLDTRTAPQLIVRQIKERYTLPHLRERVPAYTLVLMQMRRSMRDDTPAGFEFAAEHWSACPARRYLRAMFEDVWEQSRGPLAAGGVHE